jgi:asparagine synthase (glutamine-hydrolysing)
MAHSLEVRAPILDHKLMEYVGSLPSNLKLKGNESKYIFKKMLENRLPPEIVYRRKQGFSIPLATWLRDEMKGFAEETLFLSQNRLSTFFNLKYIEDLWRKHLSRRQDYAYPLWGLMMFSLWQQKFFKQ